MGLRQPVVGACAATLIVAALSWGSTGRLDAGASVRAQSAPVVIADALGDTDDARADVVAAGVTVLGDRITFTTTVDQYTNPTGDGSWVAGVTGPTWELDIDGDQVKDYWIVLSNIQGTLFGSFYGLPPSQYCAVERSADAATSTYTAAVSASCLGPGITTVGVAAVMNYRTFDMVIHTDRAPDAGWSAFDVSPTAAPAPALVGVPPTRLMDTRQPPTGQSVDDRFVGLGRRPGGSITAVQVAGRGGVPADAGAALVTITAIDPSAPGYLTAFACGTTPPVASTVNAVGPGVESNTTVAPLAADGTMCIVASATVDIAVDVTAFVPAGGSFSSVPPARLLDTRPPSGGAVGTTVDGLGAGTGRQPAGSIAEVLVAGRGGVDPTAAGVYVNVTAVAPDADGFLTVFPCGGAPPLASHSNYLRGEIVATSVYAQVGTAGEVCVYTSAATDLVLDVMGFHVPRALLAPIVPVRLADSRGGPDTTVDGVSSGFGPLAAGATVEIQVAGRSAIPPGATAVVLTATAVGPELAGFLTVHPCLGATPTVSHVSYAAGDVKPGTVVVPLSASGSICVSTLRRTHLVVDASGYVPGPG